METSLSVMNYAKMYSHHVNNNNLGKWYYKMIYLFFRRAIIIGEEPDKIMNLINRIEIPHNLKCKLFIVFLFRKIENNLMKDNTKLRFILRKLSWFLKRVF